MFRPDLMAGVFQHLSASFYPYEPVGRFLLKITSDSQSDDPQS